MATIYLLGWRSILDLDGEPKPSISQSREVEGEWRESGREGGKGREGGGTGEEVFVPALWAGSGAVGGIVDGFYVVEVAHIFVQVSGVVGRVRQIVRAAYLFAVSYLI